MITVFHHEIQLKDKLCFIRDEQLIRQVMLSFDKTKNKYLAVRAIKLLVM
jgi:hypothetical protein